MEIFFGFESFKAMNTQRRVSYRLLKHEFLSRFVCTLRVGILVDGPDSSGGFQFKEGTHGLVERVRAGHIFGLS